MPILLQRPFEFAYRLTQEETLTHGIAHKKLVQDASYTRRPTTQRYASPDLSVGNTHEATG